MRSFSVLYPRWRLLRPAPGKRGCRARLSLSLRAADTWDGPGRPSGPQSLRFSLPVSLSRSFLLVHSRCHGQRGTGDFLNVKDNANSEEGLSDRLRCSGVPLELARTRATLPLTDPGSLPSSRDGQAGKT